MLRMKGNRTKQLAYLLWPCKVNILVIKTSIDELTGHGIESRLTLPRCQDSCYLY